MPRIGGAPIPINVSWRCPPHWMTELGVECRRVTPEQAAEVATVLQFLKKYTIGKIPIPKISIP